MNLYTAKYEATRPSPQAVTVPLNSNFAVGVGVTFQDNPVEVAVSSMTLNGVSADNAYANMAVFNLSSDGNEGREVYDIATLQPGLTSKELNFYLSCELSNGRGVLSTSIADWEGVTITYDTTPSSSYDYGKNPFGVTASTVDGVSRGGLMTYFTNADLTKTYAYSKNKQQGFGSKYQTLVVLQPDGTWLETNTFTIPANCYVYSDVYVDATRIRGEMSAHYVEKFRGNYKLFVDKKNMNMIEGYLDASSVAEDIFANTVNLSGTLSDDTTFSYELPYKAD